MSDDYDGDKYRQEPPGEPLNWADMCWSLAIVPFYVAKGLMVAFDNLQKGLFNASQSIDARRKFAREVGQSIESLSRGER